MAPKVPQHPDPVADRGKSEITPLRPKHPPERRKGENAAWNPLDGPSTHTTSSSHVANVGAEGPLSREASSLGATRFVRDLGFVKVSYDWLSGNGACVR
jgi:hypothetical protein